MLRVFLTVLDTNIDEAVEYADKTPSADAQNETKNGLE